MFDGYEKFEPGSKRMKQVNDDRKTVAKMLATVLIKEAGYEEEGIILPVERYIHDMLVSLDNALNNIGTDTTENTLDKVGDTIASGLMGIENACNNISTNQ